MNRLHLMRKVKNIIDLGGGEKQSGEPRIASMIKGSRTAGYKKTALPGGFFVPGRLTPVEHSKYLQGPVGHLQHTNQFLRPEAFERIYGDSLCLATGIRA